MTESMHLGEREVNMDNIRFPGLIWGGGAGAVSPEQAMANMEEEKTFMGPSLVVISLPVPKRLKKRRVSRRARFKIKRVNAKLNADLSVLHYDDI